jgi:hypothetical protein
MAQEGIATLPMQGMAPQESQGIGAFEPAQQPSPEGDMVPVSEFDRFEAIITALEQQTPGLGDKIQQILDEANLTPEQVEGLASVVEFLEQNKANYPAAIQSLIAEGAIEEGDFPPQYNEEFMIILKMVVYGYQMRERMAQPEPVPFAKGGLAMAAEALRQQGRGGDTILAHINPEEARLLKRMGGSGTINPQTGLPEFLKFKGITKAVTGAVKGAVKAVGGAVKSVVGAANKILGPELTMIALTVGGFMIGGPALAPYLGSFAGAAGAALGSAVGTYGSGGSFKDVLLNSATAFAGAHFAPTYGIKGAAAIGGISTLARGGSFKDALKSAAISAGSAALMQGLSPATEGTPPDVSTPGSISGTNPSGAGNTPVLTPDTVSPFELNAGPPPGAAPAPNYNLRGPVPTAPSTASSLGSLNFQAPTNYLAGAPSAGSAGISALPNAVGGTAPMTLGQVGSNIMQGNFGQAGSDALKWMGQNKLLTAGAALGLTGAMGGFKPEPVAPPGLVERDSSGRPITGENLIANDPNRYIVQNLPGVNYNPSGGIDFTRNTVAPTQFNINPSPAYGMPGNTVANSPMYGAPPTYQAPTGAVGAVPNTGIQQPYNTAGMYDFMNYNPYMPRQYNMGGPVMNAPQPEFMPGTSVAMYNKGGISQYPRRTGQISGPGTETSDDIPAMLSDGEFVMTARAVRGVGNGSRREGAKKLYRMMHAMEKKAGGKV